MNRIASLALAAFAACALLATADADAKRMGGGKNFGAQRSATPDAPAKAPAAGAPAAPASNAAATPPGAGPASNPVMAPGAAAPAAAAKAAPAGAAAASGGSRWMAPIAGLAAGLGLAALASYLGFGEELASFLLIALLAVAAIVVVRLLLRRGAPAANRPMPYAGAGAGLGGTPGGYETQVPPASKFEPVFGGGAPSQPVAPKRAFPPGFDAEAFAREARKQFLAVQSAHDRQDVRALADVMTPELHKEIAREIEASGAARPTQIVDVAAEVVDVATEGREHWVSVRFTGTAREGGVDEPFDEMWNLVKPVDGSSGWLIGGIQQVVVKA